MRQMAEEKCQEMGITLPLDEIAGECSVGQQQMTEITRNLMLDAKTVIMDEPTAALTERETDSLFEVMRKLKAKGVSIIYISHRMEEVFNNCDTITVMRDGQTISSRPTEETNMDQIVGDMVGRVMSEYYPARTNVPGDEVFKVEDFSQPGVFEHISFSVRKGEILGVAGLMGAGRTSVVKRSRLTPCSASRRVMSLTMPGRSLPTSSIAIGFQVHEGSIPLSAINTRMSYLLNAFRAPTNSS